MRQAAQGALVVGLISLVIGIYSRLTVVPIMDIEAQAFLQFTQACFLFTIAATMLSCRKE